MDCVLFKNYMLTSLTFIKKHKIGAYQCITMAYIYVYTVQPALKLTLLSFFAGYNSSRSILHLNFKVVIIQTVFRIFLWSQGWSLCREMTVQKKNDCNYPIKENQYLHNKRSPYGHNQQSPVIRTAIHGQHTQDCGK